MHQVCDVIDWYQNKHKHIQNTVYVWTIFSIILAPGMTGMKLMFFTVVHMMFWFAFMVRTMLIKNHCLAIAELCLHRITTFFLPSPKVSRLDVGKKLEKNPARTGDPNWPKRYFMQHKLLSNKYWGKGRGEWEGLSSKVAAAWKLAGHQCACGRCWVTVSASLIFLFFFPSFIKQPLFWFMSFLAFAFSVLFSVLGEQEEE